MIEKILCDQKDNFSAAVFQFDTPGLSWHRLAQNDWMIIYLMEGSAHVSALSIDTALGKDQLLILPPDYRCTVRALSLHAETLHIRLSQANQIASEARRHFFQTIGKPVLPTALEIEKTRIHLLVQRLIEEFSNQDDYYLYNAYLLVEQMLILLLRLNQHYTPEQFQNDSPIYELSILIKQAIHYIDQHYDEKISLSNLAQALWTNPSYLSRQFKLHVGISFTEFITQKRIYMAKSLLVNSQQPIGTIALNVGFQNIPYFNSVFKRFTGESPSDFRKNHKISIASNNRKDK